MKLESKTWLHLATAALLGSGCVGPQTDEGVAESSLTGDDLTSPLFSADFASSPAPFTVIAGGTWAVTGGRYVLSNPAADLAISSNLAVHDTSVAGDFRLDVTGRTTGTSSAWNDFSVVFSYTDAQNYAYASFNESNDDATSGLFKVVAGVQTQLADITTAIKSDTDYAVRIVRIGTTVQVLLDGVTVATATDAKFGNGKVGFGSRNDGASFDNLHVYVRDAFVTGTSEPVASNTGLNVNGLTTADLTVTNTSANGDLLVNDAWVAAHGTTQTINGISTRVIDKIWVKGFLTFTATSPVLFTNSQFEGRSFTGAAPLDAVIHARSTSAPIGARVSFQNCKITVVQPDVNLTTAAGERLGDMVRCDISRGSDGLDYWNPAAGQRVWGSYFHDYSFWAHDAKHATDPTNPGWSHNDYIQSSGGNGLDIWGSSFEIHAAVGVGDVATLTATGFPNRNWGSGIALTAGVGHITNAQIHENWFRGGQVHVFLPTQHTGIDFGDSMTVHHNRHDFGLHGYGPYSGSYSKQFVRWGYPMGPAVTDVHDNVLLSEANVPVNLRGTLLPTATLVGGATSTGQYIVSINAATP